jgi:predicted secreted protein
MVDTIPYTVVKTAGKVEFRKYQRIVLATVYGLSENAAFGILFDYIAGANKSKQRISMTAPVVSSDKIAMTAPVISDRGSFSFVLPKGSTIETAPEPIDSRVVLDEIPARTLAVLRFKGRTGTSTIDARKAELMTSLSKAGIQTRGDMLLMRYNSPFTPGFMRRNEVAIEIVANE